MNLDEAKAWLQGERSLINIITSEDSNLWHVYTAQADAAMTQQAYWIVRAHTELAAVLQEEGK